MLHQCSTDHSVESIADLLLTAQDLNVPELIETIKNSQYQNPKEILLFYTNVLSERQDLPIQLIMELTLVLFKALSRLNVKKRSSYFKQTYHVFIQLMDIGLPQEHLLEWINQIQAMMAPEMDWENQEDQLQWICHVHFLLKMVELSQNMPTITFHLDTLFKLKEHWPQKGLILLLSHYCQQDLKFPKRSCISKVYSKQWLLLKLSPFVLMGLQQRMNSTLSMTEYLWTLLPDKSLNAQDLMSLPQSNYCYMEIFEQLLHWLAFPDGPETQRKVYHTIRQFIAKLNTNGLYALFHYLIQAQKEPERQYRLAANTLLTNTLKQNLPMDLNDLWFNIRDNCWTLPKHKDSIEDQIQSLLSEEEQCIYCHSSWISNNLNLFLLVEQLARQGRIHLPIDLEIVKTDWIDPMLPHCHSILNKLANTPYAFQIEILVMSIHQIYS